MWTFYEARDTFETIRAVNLTLREHVYDLPETRRPEQSPRGLRVSGGINANSHEVLAHVRETVALLV